MAQINKPTDYFNTVTYTGDGTAIGSGGKSITVGFQPDFVWIKSRSSAYNSHVYDSIRGVQKRIITNLDYDEITLSESLESFDTDGFTLGNQGAHNASGDTYVSWNWLAGGTASSNTDGSITSSVSANTAAGFSIVSYTGTGSAATIGHGLGGTPELIIVKRRTTTGGNWSVYNYHDTATKVMFLNSSGSAAANSTYWNNTEPTSTVFSVGTQGDTNSSGATFIAYCFRSIKGYSKVGTYVGNSSADGTFVYTGFKPAFQIGKGSDIAEGWNITDNKRAYPFNPTGYFLYAQANNAESVITYSEKDFLSNGFKCRNSHGQFNQSGNTYIYYAVAEQPLVGTNNIPATAR